MKLCFHCHIIMTIIIIVCGTQITQLVEHKTGNLKFAISSTSFYTGKHSPNSETGTWHITSQLTSQFSLFAPIMAAGSLMVSREWRWCKSSRVQSRMSQSGNKIINHEPHFCLLIRRLPL